MNRKGILMVIVVVFALMISMTASAQMTDDLSGTAWELVSIGGSAVLDDTTITLAFGPADQAAGSAGCNSYSSVYAVEGDSISFTLPVATLMACMDAGVMEQEQAYLSALPAATTFEIVDGDLVVTYGEGELLVFESQPALAGSSWTLVMIDGAAPLADTSLTLTFGQDNRLSGSGGCNSFGAAYSVNGQNINIAMPISTLMACSPEAVMEQEQAYLAALEAATTFEITDGQLTIIHGDGQQLVFEAQPTLADTMWALISLGGEDVMDGTAVTLQFGPAGEAFGSTGCNNFRTTYVRDGDSLTFA
ncbi:MAG: META domain-containing protein, partial [Chloroflexota bacterium]